MKTFLSLMVIALGINTASAVDVERQPAGFTPVSQQELVTQLNSDMRQTKKLFAQYQSNGDELLKTKKLLTLAKKKQSPETVINKIEKKIQNLTKERNILAQQLSENNAQIKKLSNLEAESPKKEKSLSTWQNIVTVTSKLASRFQESFSYIGKFLKELLPVSIA